MPSFKLKTSAMRHLALGVWLFSGAWSFGVGTSANLEVEFATKFNQTPLSFDKLINQTAAGQKISVTRLDFLLSNLALQRADGTWIGQPNWFAYISAREGRTNFTMADVPVGNYDRVRFQIGVEPAVNHGNATQWPAEHPLNPQVNHLYWDWSHEYIFFALEGGWQNGSQQSGFSYHLATDRELMTIELPVGLDLSVDRKMQLVLDAGKIFTAPNKIKLSETTDTSHSRTNDLLAVQLRENVAAAFSIGTLETVVRHVPDSPAGAKLNGTFKMAPSATPYHLTVSAFAPQPDLPRDNPLTVEGVSLGSQLFFDRRLSAGDRQSCANCHDPHLAFAQPRRFSRGVDGVLGTRNAMPLENLAWKSAFFWDGRAATLREQVLQPIQNPVEMHESLANAVAKISADPDYHRRFAGAFGSPEITTDTIARALEQFLLVQVSFDAKFDRVMNGREKFTASEQRGYELFNTEYDPYHGQYGADCFHCHGGPLFQSQSFANNGLDSVFRDLGRYQATKQAGDGGKFAVPSLRNVAMTAPYMHDGRFRTLNEVVQHYCTGMKRSATLDPNLAKHPDGGVPLSLDDQRALVAFLKTLTDEKFLPTARIID
ncbi:MAG TPA: MbnP family protein [Verrucomicrobiae bacterium]|jgi:cytochrome c peroxidase